MATHHFWYSLLPNLEMNPTDWCSTKFLEDEFQESMKNQLSTHEVKSTPPPRYKPPSILYLNWINLIFLQCFRALKRSTFKKYFDHYCYIACFETLFCHLFYKPSETLVYTQGFQTEVCSRPFLSSKMRLNANCLLWKWVSFAWK